MSLGIIRIRRGSLPIQAGKFVQVNGQAVYVYDRPAIYRTLNALGINKSVLVAMHQYGYKTIHFNLDGHTYVTTLEDVLHYAIEDPAQRKPDHLYLPLKFWKRQPKQSYPWMQQSWVVELPYAKKPHTLTVLRERAQAEVAAAEAARPRQASLF